MIYRLKLYTKHYDELSVFQADGVGRERHLRVPTDLIMHGDWVDGFYYKQGRGDAPVPARLVERKEVFETGIKAFSHGNMFLSDDTHLIYKDKKVKPLSALHYSAFGEGRTVAAFREHSMKDGFYTSWLDYTLRRTATPYPFLQLDFEVFFEGQLFYQNFKSPILLEARPI